MELGIGLVNFRFPTFGLAVKHDGHNLLNARFFNPNIENLPLFSGFENELSHQIAYQLECYVKDPTVKFNLPYDLNGSVHQLKVWHVMESLKCGEILTYGDVASKIGSAPRAVGGACGKNPLPVIIPCHRILAANHGLGGFNSGNIFFGLGIKRWLLAHEGVFFKE